MKSLTLERLRECLSYDPDTGRFTRRISTSTAKAGAIAGSPRGDGYLVISVDNEQYLAHRLAWFYVRGAWPAHHTDHIDLDRQNNALGNLREATASQNVANTRQRRCNTSGAKGVYWSKIRRKWIAQIGHHKRVINLGGFTSFADAKRARDQAEITLFGEFRCQAN